MGPFVWNVNLRPRLRLRMSMSLKSLRSLYVRSHLRVCAQPFVPLMLTESGYVHLIVVE